MMNTDKIKPDMPLERRLVAFGGDEFAATGGLIPGKQINDFGIIGLNGVRECGSAF